MIEEQVVFGVANEVGGLADQWRVRYRNAGNGVDGLHDFDRTRSPVA
jgi:hypothetical protein